MADNAINEFLTALHPPDLLRDSYIELRAFNKGKRELQQFFTNHDEAIVWSLKHMTTHNVYVGVNPRFRRDGHNDSVQRSYWAWADIDGYKLNLSSAEVVGHLISRIVLPPTMVVYSGSNGGTHVYWRIAECTELSYLQDLNNRIADALQSDRLGDPARILRVAGTLNHKSVPPTPVQLAHYVPTFSYSVNDLEAALRIDQQTRQLIVTGASEKHPSRSERDFAVVGALVRAGMTDNAIEIIFNNHKIGDKKNEHENPDHYLAFSINKIRKEENLQEGEISPLHKVTEWGIIELKDAWWKVLPNGELKRLSSFVFDPEVVLEDENRVRQDDIVIGTVRAYGEVWPNVSISKKAFNRSDTLIKELPKLQWQYVGTEKDVRPLGLYLYEKLREKGNGVAPTRTATPILGHHNGLFVTHEKTYDKVGALKGYDASIVWLPTGRDFPNIVIGEYSDEEFLDALQEFVDLYFYINDPSVVVPALGWFIATLFKPKLRELGVFFPILNIFGTRGSGKTTLIREVLQPLVGYKEPRTYDANTTAFVMLGLLGSSNCTPISFSEFRRSSLRDSGERLIRYILLGYDGGSDSRGRADQTTIEYPLIAPFTVDGEDAISDPACLERTIQINLHPETIAEGTACYDNFQTVREICLPAIASFLVRWSIEAQPQYQAALDEVHEIFQGSIPDRVRKNFAVIVCGYRMFEQFCNNVDVQLPEFDMSQILLPALQNVISTQTGRTSLLIDDMIEDVVNETSFSLTDRFIYHYDDQSNMFYFNFTTAYSWWVAHRRKQGLPVLDKQAIKRQLVERMVHDNGLPQPGNYIIGTESRRIGKSTHHVHVISLAMAKETGLDVPDRIAVFKPNIEIKNIHKV